MISSLLATMLCHAFLVLVALLEVCDDSGAAWHLVLTATTLLLAT